MWSSLVIVTSLLAAVGPTAALSNNCSQGDDSSIKDSYCSGVPGTHAVFCDGYDETPGTGGPIYPAGDCQILGSELTNGKNLYGYCCKN
ncbi:hypothetical protein LY78DRAFT_18138 [Colletotrichum sublineola]|nr:hypothetical protein LY78DRAFT_18138 [Colletotrichum sublineola]